MSDIDQPPDAPAPGGTADAGHPDLEGLNALVDGEDEAASSHVRSCRECAARVEGFRRIRAELGRPLPPPPPAVREQAIAAALAAAGAAPSPRPAAPRPVAATAGPGTAESEASERGTGDPATASPLPSPRFPRATTWVLGLSAAALVLVVALAAVLLRTDRRGDETTSGAGRTFGAERSESQAAKAPPADSGLGPLDLGEVGSADELAGRVRPLLSGIGPVAEAQAARRAPAPPPEAGAPDIAAPGSGARDQALTPGAATCEAEAVAAARRAGAAPRAPVLWATATSGSQPAVIVVYPASPGEPPGSFRAVALSREGCRVLLSVLVAAATP
jgi:hypothetical protein